MEKDVKNVNKQTKKFTKRKKIYLLFLLVSKRYSLLTDRKKKSR